MLTSVLLVQRERRQAVRQTAMILGTEYRIEIHKWSEDKELSQNSWAGYCCSDFPLIVIADLDDEEHFWFSSEEEKDVYFKSCLRHEIIHAFLNESGLKDNFEHVPRMGHEETMVDWIANQFPKIAAVYEELGIL